MESVKNTVNFPIKGIDKDTHYSTVSNEKGTDLINVRVLGTEGDNTVFVNINGNRVLLELSNGYYPLGFSAYKDILYIVSRNNSGIVEVGSYPSPKLEYNNDFHNVVNTIVRPIYNDISQNELEYVYKPFVNLSIGNMLLGFRTKVFEYPNKPVYIVFKESFDGSVNLYLSNGINRNRVVNSYFNKDGFISKRLKSHSYEDNLEKIIDVTTQQFMAIHEPPRGRLQEVSHGGELPCGNLFLYIRYLDYEYNATNFMPLEGPISIYHGNEPFNIYGSNPEKLIDLSDKQVKIKIKYLDTSFHFFEIAMVRQTGGTGTLNPVCHLIGNRMEVGNNKEIDVVITGKEPLSNLSIDDIIRPVIKENTCLMQMAFGNRLWGVNWKEEQYNREAMANLARLVYGVPTLFHEHSMYNENRSYMRDYPYFTAEQLGDKGDKSWYQDSFQVLDNVGYFRGEIYPFAIVGLKTDGSLTEAFPITGYDNYIWGDNEMSGSWKAYSGNSIETKFENNPVSYLSNPDNTNNGFIRMPQFGTSFNHDWIDDVRKRLTVELRVKYALDYFEENKALFKGLRGFYVVRADRLKNLVGHGIMENTYNFVKGDFQVFNSHIAEPVNVKQSIIGTMGPGGMSGDLKGSLSFPMITAGSVINYNYRGYINLVSNVKSTEKYNFYSRKYARTNTKKRALFIPEAMFAKDSILENNRDYYIYQPYVLSCNVNATLLAGNPLGYYMMYLFNPHIGRTAKMSYLIEHNQGDLLFKTNIVNGEKKWNLYSKLLFTSNDSSDNNRNPYIKVSATYVPTNTYSTVGRFSSKIQDIVLGEEINPGFRIWWKDGSDEKEVGNQDMRTPSYIGLDINPREGWPNKEIYARGVTLPFLLYKYPNTYSSDKKKNYYNKVINIYKDGNNNLSSIMYYLNNQFIDFEGNRKRISNSVNINEEVSIKSNGLFLKGDCFINRVFYRMTYNGESYSFTEVPNSNEWDTGYDHGGIVSVPLMSEINTSMRGSDNIGFYPLWAKDSADTDDISSMLSYGRFGGTVNRLLGEDFIYDYGHSVTQYMNVIPGIDKSLHEHTLTYTGRVRYTDTHITGSYVDGWRVMYYNSKQDFPPELGEITGIAYFMDYVIAICSKSMIQLRIDIKVSQEDKITGTEVYLGLDTIIDKTFRKLSEFGSQHSSIISGFNGVYGYDHDKSIFWKIVIEQGDKSVYLAARSISDHRILSDLIWRKKVIGDLKGNILDLHSEGVSFGYDEYNKETLFTVTANREVEVYFDKGRFYYYDIGRYDISGYVAILGEREGSGYEFYSITDITNDFVQTNSDITGKRKVLIDFGFTYVYSELLDSIYQYTFKSPLYSFYKGSIITYNRLFSPNGGRISINNNEANKALFWGFRDGIKIGVIINDSKEGLEKFHKMMSSVVVLSDDIKFSKLEVYTENQYSHLFPFYNEAEFWNLPEFSENTWKINIPVQRGSGKSGYDDEAQMRGTWIRIVFKYGGINRKYIGAIIGKYILSFN